MVQSGQAATAIKKAADAKPKVSTGKLVKDLAINAAMFTPTGRALKVIGLAAKAAKISKDVEVANAMRKTAAIKKRMDAVDKADAAATSKVADSVKANIDKAEASGKYGKPKPVLKKAAAKPTLIKPKKSQVIAKERAKATFAKAEAKAIKAKLAAEKPKLSDTPKLNNETKKLLEKFQRGKVEPFTTRTALGGRIGEARPLAKGQRLKAYRAELEKREVTIIKKDPKVIEETRKARKATESGKVTLPLKRPARPTSVEKLTDKQKRFKSDNTAVEQDLTGESRFSGKTIESRTSQHPGSRGTNIKTADKSTEEELVQRKVDAEVDKKWTKENKYPAAESPRRIVRRPQGNKPGSRIVAVKKAARAKRAAETTAIAKGAKAKTKLSPAKRIAIKKIVKATVENSKKPIQIRTSGLQGKSGAFGGQHMGGHGMGGGGLNINDVNK